MTCIKNHVNGYSDICLILIKCTNFDPYLMDMHVRTEGKKLVFSQSLQNLRLLLTLIGSKPHSIIIFHLKTNMQNNYMENNMQNLEKHHVNGS